MSRYKSRPRHIVAFSVWLGGLIVFYILSWWNVTSAEKDAVNSLISEATRSASQLANLMALSLWELDEPTAKAAINGAMEDERIYAVKITGDHKMLAGQRRNYLWEPVPWDDEITEYTIQGMNPIRGADEALGRVEVWVSPRVMQEENTLRIQRETWRMAILAIIWTGVLVLVCWHWGDFRHIRKHIGQNPERVEDIIMGFQDEAGASEAPEAPPSPGSSPINPLAGRRYQRSHPDSWHITGCLFKQVFANAPNLMSRLYSDGELAGLCHVGRMLEQAAPCLGAETLANAARRMQMALNDPDCTAKALPVEMCVFALEEVLTSLSDVC